MTAPPMPFTPEHFRESFARVLDEVKSISDPVAKVHATNLIQRYANQFIVDLCDVKAQTIAEMVEDRGSNQAASALAVSKEYVNRMRRRAAESKESM